jgi:hypothetical protein
MNPKQYEWMAIERGDGFRRDAAGSHVLARAGWTAPERTRPQIGVDVRTALVRLAHAALRAGRLSVRARAGAGPRA